MSHGNNLLVGRHSDSLKAYEPPLPELPQERLELLSWLASTVNECARCDAPLKGQQRRYCSRFCQNNLHAQEQRARGYKGPRSYHKPGAKKDYYQANKEIWVEARKKRKERLAADPEKLARHRKNAKEGTRRYRERIKADPERLAAHRAKRKAAKERAKKKREAKP